GRGGRGGQERVCPSVRVLVETHDLPGIIYAEGLVEDGSEGDAERTILAPALHGGVIVSGPGGNIETDNLAGIVDSKGTRGARIAAGKVERGVAAAAQKIAVVLAGSIRVKPHDLSGIVDAPGYRVGCTRRGRHGVLAAAEQEAVAGTDGIL